MARLRIDRPAYVVREVKGIEKFSVITSTKVLSLVRWKRLEERPLRTVYKAFVVAVRGSAEKWQG